MPSLDCITSHRVLSSGEMPINSGSEMEYEAHEMQQPRHITKIGEEASTAQRSDSFEQPHATAIHFSPVLAPLIGVKWVRLKVIFRQT
ncbi:MAG: hypothetical protein K2P74_11205 [Nitrosomonas sp.]|nr:hypothetical protein [Nitrosomonas sp.]